MPLIYENILERNRKNRNTRDFDSGIKEFKKGLTT
jgi:hypothetical protein